MANRIYNIKNIIEWFKEFFRTCPFKKNFTKKDQPFLIIGHRGAPSAEAENTIPSLERAMKEGANGLEIDLCITSDKHIILWHDWNPNDALSVIRETGFEPFIKFKPHPPAIGSEYRRKISSLTLEEVRENFRYKVRHRNHMIPYDVKIPTLAEFFEWTKNYPKLKMVCLDIKTPDDEAGLSLEMLCNIKELIAQHDSKFEVVIEVASTVILNVMKKKYPGFNYCLDVEPPPGIILKPLLYSAVESAVDHNNTYALSLRPRKITIGNFTTYRRILKHDVKLVRNLRRLGPENSIKYLLAATVSKRSELKCLVRLGIEGIQTDFPGRLYRITRRYKRHLW